MKYFKFDIGDILDVEFTNLEGKKVKLPKGKWVVLYFYPKDNTKGCTTEALEFSGLIDEFKKLNAEVIGVSPDKVESHKKFIAKHNLKVKFLSDENKAVLEKLGVWQLKKMYGREYYGVVRTTVLVDPDGKIEYVWEKVKAKGHAKEVLEKLRELIER
ncbi:Peroxiredoxin [Thermosipho sp. 1063]|uniref:peroxiredoxin n=1 Tax=unclassified Thermosipho (in: thermotogales) TaxID=2676525 RepID=UPI0009492C4E|nr:MULTISPECIES: peroxiredoxin [unclassified Thermosipho (in: thermotogales)]ANQ53751.1 bacterioferritin comigratory protein [Thermosipho sp. 1070]APT72197.1 Peroxiredoxin [Thermosipho sp. 1063]OOC43438.1 peroxiredoxin [Thermosipho sp. 1074]